ncbi:MAG: hypothetical protein H0U55_15315 [Rubrobacteraceae bacterium]|nr:hypothetical protein [Rubrobacteraceae bacterium]
MLETRTRPVDTMGKIVYLGDTLGKGRHYSVLVVFEAQPLFCALGEGDEDETSGTTTCDSCGGIGGGRRSGGFQDAIYGDEGNDSITDDEDTFDLDRIYGDEGNDTIRVQEGRNGEDTVNCGSGAKDRVFFDRGIDVINRNCEIRNPGQ